jgi:hypothetical protein
MLRIDSVDRGVDYGRDESSDSLRAMVVFGAVGQALQSCSFQFDDAITFGLFKLKLSPDGLFFQFFAAAHCIVIEPDLMLAILQLAGYVISVAMVPS